mgnify:CR=1 FL=1
MRPVAHHAAAHRQRESLAAIRYVEDAVRKVEQTPLRQHGLAVGAIVAVFALVQDRRLRAARLSPANQLFAPLETTERLLKQVAKKLG